MSQYEMSQSSSITSPKIKSGRPKSAEKRKNMLAAAELGYSATTMDLVAAKANVSKQTVYSHFKNKDDAYVWAVTFLNMLKGDFHFRSILGLSYSLSETQQEKLVATAVANFRKLILK